MGEDDEGKVWSNKPKGDGTLFPMRAWRQLLHSSTTTKQYCPWHNIALVQVLSGVQGVEVHCYDEALAIPSAESEKVAIRTVQIVAHETGIINTIDPLGGSYYVEALTDEIEQRVMKLFEQVETMVVP